MTTESLPPFAHEWMAQWRRASQELPKIRAAELRRLESADLLAALSLLDLPSPSDTNPHENGLVVQQKWFMRQRLLEVAEKESKNGETAQAPSIGD